MRSLIAQFLALVLLATPVAPATFADDAQPTPPAPAGAGASAPSSQFVYDAPSVAPEKSADLIWRYNGAETAGRWFTQNQMVNIATSLKRAEAERDSALDAAAQAKTEALQAENETKVNAFPAWIWIAGGLVVGGVAGYFIGRATTSSSSPAPATAPPAAVARLSYGGRF